MSCGISFICSYIFDIPDSQNTLPCILLHLSPKPYSRFKFNSRGPSSRKPLLISSEGGSLSGSHSLCHSSAKGYRHQKASPRTGFADKLQALETWPEDWALNHR